MYKFILWRLGLWCVIALIPVAAIAQFGPSSDPAQLGLSEERLDRIRQVVERHIAEGSITGAVTLVARQNQITYLEAFGHIDADPSRPMRPDTLFRVASMTKPVTAVAALMLYEQGRFTLDDPVHDLIPELRDPKVLLPDAADATSTEPLRRPISFRHLFNHTSGYTYRLFGHPVLADIYEERQIQIGLSVTTESVGTAVKRLAGVPLQFQPGDQWQYGISSDVLGNVVEIIHGADLETVFQEEIFGPLGMLDSYFYPPEKELDRLADYYYPIPEHSGTQVNIEGMPYSAADEYFNGPRQYMAGGAGLVTTIVDYWRFCQMLSNGGVLDGTRLLARPTVGLMTQNSIGDKDIFLTELGDKMGLAVGIRTKRGQTGQLESNGSYGWAGGFHHLFWVDPSEQLIGIIMTQRVPGKSQNLAEAFKVLTYQAIVD